ncbi:Major facilitator, sugar transporter-like [Trema orientale]|uniref:Major facilitator, sugar transporter-like n=1 Tax=Trema orientale TaxID=63057 RepID=A0A2P5FX36_TREOI|nr:Major facilitator, sugar transporter-like [Trema orientale]
MAIGECRDVDNSGEIRNSLEDLEQPFIKQHKVVAYEDEESDSNSSVDQDGSIGVVLLSTFVAVCGSFEFGSCLMIVVGSSLAFVLGTVISWRSLALTGLSSGKIGTIAYACVQVPITVVGAILMDKSGRRPLIMVSATGTFLGCFLAGASFFLKGQGLLLEWAPVIAVAGVLELTSSTLDSPFWLFYLWPF